MTDIHNIPPMNWEILEGKKQTEFVKKMEAAIKKQNEEWAKAQGQLNEMGLDFELKSSEKTGETYMGVCPLEEN